MGSAMQLYNFFATTLNAKDALAYIFVAGSMGLPSFKFVQWAPPVPAGGAKVL